MTFTVQDTDEVAHRAEAAGGQILVPPTTTPPVRTATLADSSGATFVASAFNP